MPLRCTGPYVVAAILTVPAAAASQVLADEVAAPTAAPLPPTPGSVAATADPAMGRGAIPQAQDSELGKPTPQPTQLRFEVGLDGNFTVAGSPNSGAALGVMMNLGYTLH